MKHEINNSSPEKSLKTFNRTSSDFSNVGKTNYTVSSSLSNNNQTHLSSSRMNSDLHDDIKVILCDLME